MKFRRQGLFWKVSAFIAEFQHYTSSFHAHEHSPEVNERRFYRGDVSY
jgi:hypothetical protein